MTPEQLARFEQMERMMEEVMRFLNKLMSTETIPIEVQSAFASRLGGIRLSTSAKDPTTETTTINESGSATKTALAVPDGFRSVIVEGGSTINIPYYN